MNKNLGLLLLILLTCSLLARRPQLCTQSARLAGKKLSTPWGVMELEHHTVPRLRPTAAMVQTGQPFSIEGIRLGMSRSEVQKLYPHYATSFHEPDVFFYGDFPHGARVNYGPSNRVKTISGDRLEQSGRRLFNERSRLSDVERLKAERANRAPVEEEQPGFSRF